MSRQRFINLFPVFSSLLIETGQFGQLYRMWTRHTVAGQNPWSYLSLLLALGLWVFYHKQNKAWTALIVTSVSCVVIVAIIVTILVLQ